MKFVVIAALFAVIHADEDSDEKKGGKKYNPPSVGLGHKWIPATREDYNNPKDLWKGDWKKYRASRPNDQDCSISESDNWKGAQQCSQSWECRGARLCERGGWCSGYDGCEGTPLPEQAPGLLPDC